MSFDSSRFTFDPWNNFSGVVMQQGRVQLDSDWNEWLAEFARRIRAGTLDTLGRAVVPLTTKTAFQIGLSQDASGNVSISIGPGRMYVDGLLAENHGLPAPNPQKWIPGGGAPPASSNAISRFTLSPAWDSALDELTGQVGVDYTRQPYYPNAGVLAPFPQSGGPFLVYLDVWLRDVTFLEDPDLVEKAVGVDTTGRVQTVWQVKWLDVSGVQGVSCSTPDANLTAAWQNLLLPPGPRLTTGVVQSSAGGPCCLTPNTGYTGLENQLYRVEIHQPGSAGTATFKWSRDNASVATAVSGIAQGGTVLTVQSTGKDSVLRFSPNDWVEITDDLLELNGLPGELHQVTGVDNVANTVTFATAVSAGQFSGRLHRPDRYLPPYAPDSLGPGRQGIPERWGHRLGGLERRGELRRYSGSARRYYAASGKRSHGDIWPGSQCQGFQERRLLGLRRTGHRRHGGVSVPGAAARHPSPLRPPGRDGTVER